MAACCVRPEQPMLVKIQESDPGGIMRYPLLAAIGAAVATAFLSAASAQAPATVLTGLVRSPEEAAMEGVLVSATRAGSNITVTVVTGADGRYSFPASRLGPGRYTLGVRAVDYELDQPEGIEIGATGAKDQKEDQQKDQRCNKGPQARQDQGPGRAIVERGMARERPRYRQAEGSIAQLRRLSSGRTHHALEI